MKQVLRGALFLRHAVGLVGALGLGLQVAGCATAPPVKSLAGGETGTIYFESLTLTGAEFLNGVRQGKPAIISGVLRLPKGTPQPVPVVVQVPGSSGVGPREEKWADELAKVGVGSFIVDSFTGRGIRDTLTDQLQLSTLTMIVDAYRALALLATHPQIDPDRIMISGASRGGIVALYASQKRFQRMHGPAGREFAAYFPFYPYCNYRYVDDDKISNHPIVIFHGEADDYTPIAPCRQFVDRLRASGKTNVSLVSYRGVAHSFDNPRSAPGGFMRTFENYADCFIDESTNLKNLAEYIKSCRRSGATVMYDGKASADAMERVKELVRSITPAPRSE